MRIGVPTEQRAGEKRVALVPETVKKLVKDGFEVTVEAGAGLTSRMADAEYTEAGATIENDREKVLSADLVACVEPLPVADLATLRPGAVLVGFLRPTLNQGMVAALADGKVSSFSFDCVPRISRAQSMDVLSSMATIAGYKAVILGAEACPRFFPMLMTAAGTIRAGTVLVIGAGVAGLQAIATAKRLGAIVLAYDLRPTVKEQVESLGGRFVELAGVETGETAGGHAREQSAEQQAQQAQLLADTIAGADVVVTTAQIPDKPAPRIITAEAVSRMRAGSVIVDLPAESGGNCELTKAGETVVTANGVTVLGPLDMASSMAVPASTMYSRNFHSLLKELAPKGELNLDFANEVIAGSAVTHAGEVRHARSRELMGLPALQEATS